MSFVWEKSYPPGISWGAPLPPPVAVESLLTTAAELWPDAVAIDQDGNLISYRELYALAARAAKGFQALDVRPGDRVALHLLNSSHYVVCFFGVLLAGGIVVNLNPMIGARELTHQVSDTGARLLVTAGERAAFARLKPALDQLSLDAVVLCGGDDGAEFSGKQMSLDRLLGNDGRFAPHARGNLNDDVAVIQYTGGTTGEMKGAMLTHANFSAVIAIQRRWNGDDGLGPRGHETEQPRVLVILPFYHIFGLSCILLTSVAYGALMVLHRRFEPARVLDDVARKRINVFAGVPAMFAALADHSATPKTDFSSLKYCSSGGAALPAAVAEKFRALTGIAISEGYGLTELTPIGTQQPGYTHRGPGNVGLPLPNTTIEIVDIATGLQPLPVGSIGEICFTGPQVMKGYWGKPEATEEAFLGNRFHTGDIGFFDDGGYLNLVDRKKDMIICGGFNVFPRNIEEAILEHPDVAEVIVIGVPEPNLGQAAKAFIVQKEGTPPLTYREMRKFLASRLATYEMPIEMELRASLPKTPIGKPSKKALIAELAGAPC